MRRKFPPPLWAVLATLMPVLLFWRLAEVRIPAVASGDMVRVQAADVVTLGAVSAGLRADAWQHMLVQIEQDAGVTTSSAIQLAKLTTNAQPNTQFGHTVALDGKATLIGAPNARAAYLYALSVPPANIVLTKTVGTRPDVCSSTAAPTVAPGSPVYYCYSVRNTGSVTLTRHTLVDSHLGSRVFDAELPPGATLNTVDLGFTFNTSLAVTTTNTVTWTAAGYNYTDVATATAQATVYVRNLPTGPLRVTTTADSIAFNGDCSLREAVIAANTDKVVDGCPAGDGTDTIWVPAGSYIVQLDLPYYDRDDDAAQTGDLDITSDIILQGESVTTTVIIGVCPAGVSAQQLLEVLPHSTAEVHGVTLTGPSCGLLGISNRGHLTVRDGTFLFYNSNLGAIRNYGWMAFINSEVNSNRSWGAAVYNGGVLTMTGSRLRNNSTEHEGAALLNSGMLTMTLSTLEDNRGGSWSGPTRALDNYGTAWVRQSTIQRNEGGIRNSGNLMLEATLLARNGGSSGIDNSGDLEVIASAIVSNSASYGGGGGISNSGVATVTNSTVSQNYIHYYPCFDDIEGSDGAGIYNIGNLTLTNSTVSHNGNDNEYCPEIEPGDGGGVYNEAGTSMTIANSVIAGNIDVNGGAPDCGGTLTSLGHNLIGDLTGCTITGDSTGNVTGVAALLGPLADNGGATLTHALLSGSPALDAGNPAAPVSGDNACAATDQRGVLRPQDGNGDGNARCDMGAYEREPGTQESDTDDQGETEDVFDLHLPLLTP